ncbi:L-threonine 3-O-phosphate decarboxylase [Carbonactinospora thermoautotrophica]|uniref:Aminotransferase n=1 Tax=Carbonactinospora thermoautotrophica TaxID=1469144 RepID=A0A132MUK5_9ACTN|nr:Rv2231c family pyridoxal phosphate-dependent protein CobC [Carbonactinospora thermoautotrophica]KWX01519.1 L-threonine 3-O-phosphate decarboxylase [Carbonactinospora thermoautotrophica]
MPTEQLPEPGGETVLPEESGFPDNRPKPRSEHHRPSKRLPGDRHDRGEHPQRPAPDYDLAHHGDAEVAPGLVDLAVNVRRREPPAWLRERLTESLRDLAAYPDPGRARKAVADRHRRDPEEVLLTAGAAEAFVLIARAFRPRRAVVVHPQFTEPEAALRAAGHPVERVILTPEEGFALAPERVPEDADLVVVGNPTNPTSVLHPAGAVAALARPGRVLVVDEAFADTIPGEPESLAGRADLPGVIVLRSLTKTWGLAGLRVGYALAGPDLIRELAHAQPLWAVSTPALVAAEACSTPAALAEVERDAHALAAERAYLVERLHAVPGVHLPVRPRASFALLRVPDGRAVRERLRALGFAVRRADTFPGLGPDWLRVAVRDRGVTDAFIAALQEALRLGATHGRREAADPVSPHSAGGAKEAR